MHTWSKCAMSTLVHTWDQVCTGKPADVVPSVLYRYTQVLQRADLVNSKGKPLVTNARLEAVWKRLADRLATVVADTSVITLSTAYASHFHDIYIDGKENAKMTGDRMKMLMLTLPFMVHDLIAPEVH